LKRYEEGNAFFLKGGEWLRMNKKVFLIIFIIIFFIAATYIMEFTGNNDHLAEEEASEIADLEQENEKLRQEVTQLEESLFEARKFIYDSELASSYLPFGDATEIIFREIDESKYILIYQAGSDHYLHISQGPRPMQEMQLTIPTFDPEHGITRDIIGYNGIYYSGGIITDPEINEVRVTQDGMEHHAEIFKVDDHVRGWYVIFEDDSNDSYEKTTVQALNEEEEVLWEG